MPIKQPDDNRVKADLVFALNSLKAIGSLFYLNGKRKGTRISFQGCKAGDQLVKVVDDMHKILSEIDVSALNHAKIRMAQSVQEHCNNAKELFETTERPRGIVFQSTYQIAIAAGGGIYKADAKKCIKFLRHDIKALQKTSIGRYDSAGTLRGNVFENNFKALGWGEFAVDIVLKLQLHVEWMCEKVNGGILTKLARDEALGKRLMSDDKALAILTETLKDCLRLENPDDPIFEIQRKYDELTAAWPFPRHTALANKSAQRALAAANAASVGGAASATLPAPTQEEIALRVQYARCKVLLGDLLNRLRRMDNGLIIKGFEGAKERVEGLRGKDLLLLLGSTGSGKSTTIWFLMNKPMKMSRDTISIVPAVDDPTMASFRIGTGGNVSVTSEINAIPSNLNPNLVLVDTPGFGDTRSAVIDIVSSFSISCAVQVAKSVRILALINQANTMGNWEGLQTSLSEPLSAMMYNAYDYMASVAIKLTKFDRSNPNLFSTLATTLMGIEIDRERTSHDVQKTQAAVVKKICDTMSALEAAGKDKSKIVLLPLPGGDVARDVIDEVMLMDSIRNPTEVFRKSFVNGTSVHAVDKQMSFDSHSIKHSSRRLLDFLLADGKGVLKAKDGENKPEDFLYHMHNVDFRLSQLRDLSANLPSISSITGTFKKSSEAVIAVIEKLKEKLSDCVKKTLNLIDMDDVENEIVPGCESAQKLILYDIFMFGDETHCSYFTPLYAQDRLVEYCINCARSLSSSLKNLINLDLIEKTCALPDLTPEQFEAFESHMANEAGISLQKFSQLCSIFAHVNKAVAFGMLEMLHAPGGEYVLIAASNELSGILIDDARSRGLKTIFLKRNGDHAVGADHTISYENEDPDVIGQVSAIISYEKAQGAARGSAGGAAGGNAGGAAGGAAGGGPAVAVARTCQDNLAYGACVAAGGDSMDQHMKASVRRNGSVISYEQKLLPFDIFTSAFGEGQSAHAQAVLPRIFATFHRVCAAFDEGFSDSDFIPLCLPKLELMRVFDEMIAKFKPNVIAGATAREAYLTRKKQFIARIQVFVDEGVKVVSGDVVMTTENLINSMERGDLPSQERLDEVERFASDSKFFVAALAALAMVDQLRALHPKCIDEETMQILYGTIIDAIERLLDKSLGFICKLFTCSGAFRAIIKYLFVVETFTANPALSRYCLKLSETHSQIAAYVVLLHAFVCAQVVMLGVENADLEWQKLRKALTFLEEVSGALKNAPANFKSADKIYHGEFENVMSTMGTYLDGEAACLRAVEEPIGHRDLGLLRAYLQKFDKLNKLLASVGFCLDGTIAMKLEELIDKLLQTFKASVGDAKQFAQDYFNIDADTRLFRGHTAASLRDLRCVFISLPMLEQSIEKLLISPPMLQQSSEKFQPLTKNIQEAFTSIGAQITRFFVQISSGVLAKLNSLAPTTVMAAFCANQSDADFKAKEDQISEVAKSIKALIEFMRRLYSMDSVVEGPGGEFRSDLANDFFGSKPRMLANQFGFELLENEASTIDPLSPPTLLRYNAELAKVAKGVSTPPELKGAWFLATSLALCESYIPETYRGFSKSAEELKNKFNALTEDKKERIAGCIKNGDYLDVSNHLPSLTRPLPSHDRDLLLSTKKLLATSLEAKLASMLTEVGNLKLDLVSSHKAFFDGVRSIYTATTKFDELFRDGLEVKDRDGLEVKDDPVVLNFDPLIKKLEGKVKDHQEHIKSLMENWELAEAEKSLGGLQMFKNASFGVTKLAVLGKDETRSMFIKPLQLFMEVCVGLVSSVKLLGEEQVLEKSEKGVGRESGGGKSAPTPPPAVPVEQPGLDAEVAFANFDSVLGALSGKDMKKFLEACELAISTEKYKKMSETIRLSISEKVLEMLAVIDAAPTDNDYCEGLLTRCMTLVALVPASYNLLADNLKKTKKNVDEHKMVVVAQIENERRQANFTVLHRECKRAFLLKNIYQQRQPNHLEVYERMDAIGYLFKVQFTNYGRIADNEDLSVVFNTFGKEPLDNLVDYAKFIGGIREHIAAAEAEHSSWSWTRNQYAYPHCFYSSKKKLVIAQQWENTFEGFKIFRTHVLRKADAIADRVLVSNVDVMTIADAFAKLFGLRTFLDKLVQVVVPSTLNGVAIAAIPFDGVAAFAKTRDALIMTAHILYNIIYLKTRDALEILQGSFAQEDQGLAVARRALEEILRGLGKLKVASDVQLFGKVKEYILSGLDPTREIGAIHNFDSDLYAIAQAAFIAVIIEWTKKLNEDIVYNESLTGEKADSADRDRFYVDMSKKYELVKSCVNQLTQSNMLGTIDVMNALDQSFRAFVANMTKKLEECRKKVEENIWYLPSAKTDDAPLNMIASISRYSRSRDNLRACSERFEDRTVKAAARENLQIADASFTSYLEGVALAGEAMVGNTVYQFRETVEPFIDCLINLHFLSIYALSWKATVNARIDQVLSLRADPQNIQEKLSHLNQSMLSRNHSQQRGSDGALLAILHGHGAFLGVSIYLRNRRTNRSLESVLDHMLRLPQPNSISRDLHGSLLHEGGLFEEEYWGIVEEGLGSPDGACARILASVAPFKMDAIQGSIDRGEFSALIRNLMANVFAWWTLNKMSTYVIHRAREEDQVEDGEGDAGQPPSWRKSVMHPLPSQVVAVMLFFHGAKVSADGVLELSRQFLQIPTGEGKSVLLGVSSTILALLGFNVDCACYSAYLSSRDYKSFRPMFEAFKVLHFVSYGTFEKLCEDLINAPLKTKNADGIRGEVNTFISFGDGQDEGAAARAARTDLFGRQGRPDAVIIDEVDMFFSEAFYGASYRPLLHLRDPTITALAEYLWKHPETTLSAALASDEFKRVLGRFPTWQDFLKNKTKEMISDLRGMKDYKRDEAYVVDMGKIGEAARIGKILANHDGVLFNIVDGFCTMWAHFREHESQIIDEKGLYEAISIPIFCGAFSFAEIPTKYRNMVGVTGTLETMGDAQKRIFVEDYGIDTWNYLPTMYGDATGNFSTKRIFAGNNGKDCKIVGKGRYFQEITEEIRTRLHAVVTTPDGNTVSVEGRAVLVFFENISELRAYKLEGEKAGLSFNIMTEETSADEKESKIVNAVGKKQVTLLTKIFGRGTDFVCLDSAVLDLGGVHVIQTFLSEDVSEEIQIQGRCARMGENGSFSLIVIDESLQKLYGEGDNTSRAIAEMINAGTTYTSISQKRREYFEMQLPKKTINKVQTLRASHEASTQFVLDLLGSRREEARMDTREERIRAFLSGTNAWVGSITRAAARTVILMDATGSMGDVIGGCKNTIERMITRACRIINEVRLKKGLTDADAPSFQVQFVAYRNYNAPAPGRDMNPILEVSKWDSRHEVLAQFLGPIEADYGMGNEAIELGFQHVNKELAKEAADIDKGLDPPRIKQVILVGDVPPNTPQEVVARRLRRGEEYWQSHLGPATDSETELSKMIIPGTDGEKVRHSQIVQSLPSTKIVF